MKKIRLWYEVIKVNGCPVIKSKIRLGDLIYVFDDVWWSGNGNKRHNIKVTLIQEGIYITQKNLLQNSQKFKKYIMVEVMELMKGLKKNDCMGDLEEELYEELENLLEN